MKKLLAIDPGTYESGFVYLEDGKIVEFGKIPNDDMLAKLRIYLYEAGGRDFTLDKMMKGKPSGPLKRPKDFALVIEQIKAYQNLGDTTLWTVHWCGRFHTAAQLMSLHEDDIWYVPRQTIKRCVTDLPAGKSNDKHVRLAMIDKWGEPKILIPEAEQSHLPKSKRKKYKPGPTAGFRADMWAALAVATWYLETNPAPYPGAVPVK